MIRKTIVVSALAVSSTNAFSVYSLPMLSADFYQGVETGLMLTEEGMFDDYSCFMPEPTQAVQNYMSMIEPFKQLLDTSASDGRKTHPMSDLLGQMTGTVEKFGSFIALISPNYDSGDFCQGLTIAFHGNRLYTLIKSTVLSRITGRFDEKLDLW